jgi:hypothetical protein
MGLLLIPLVFYINKILKPNSQSDDTIWIRKILQLFFNNLGTLGLLLGLIGLFSLGLFSKDRTTEFNLHAIFALICFIGIVSGGFFVGLVIVFFPTIISKVLGIYMIIIPPITFIIFTFGQPPLSPIWEWIMVLSFCGWLLPLNLIISKQTK